MASLYSLDCLARFAPQIFGRALSLEGIFGHQVAASGRRDYVDSHTPEMRAALEALALLQKLPTKTAQILGAAHLVCGEEARKRPDTWVSLGLTFYPPKRAPKPPLSAEVSAKYSQLGLRLYHDALSVWRSL